MNQMRPDVRPETARRSGGSPGAVEPPGRRGSGGARRAGLCAPVKTRGGGQGLARTLRP